MNQRARHPFEYAVLRVVPRIERNESINAGVVLYCRSLEFLAARVHLEPDRVRALDPAADTGSIAAALAAMADLCGRSTNGTDGTGGTDIGSTFRWLTAPRSTVVQPGPVHTGLTYDPAGELDRLLTVLVLPVH